MEEQKQEALNANAAAGVPERENIVGSEEEHQRTWDESEISAAIAATNTRVAVLRDAVNKRSIFNSTNADKRLNSSLEGRDTTTLSAEKLRDLLLKWIRDTAREDALVDWADQADALAAAATACEEQVGPEDAGSLILSLSHILS